MGQALAGRQAEMARAVTESPLLKRLLWTGLLAGTGQLVTFYRPPTSQPTEG